MIRSFPSNIFESLPQAYLVGGSVRDLILGFEPLDYDVTVPSCPDTFARNIANRINGKVIVLGKDRFNVFRVVSDTFSIDITALKNGDIVTDLKKRDFTVNAIAFDLNKKQIIDCVGGLEDLKHRRIALASRNAFQKDPLRLIRAFRIAADMGFDITPETFKAIAQEAGAICQSAGERIWSELQRILACPASHTTLWDMAKTELLFFIIPELRILRKCDQNRFHKNDVFTHTLDAYRILENHILEPDKTYDASAAHFIKNMPKKSVILIKMATLLHDIGKPASRRIDKHGGIHFYGHAGKGARLSHEICKRLRMSNRQQDWVQMIIRYHQHPLALFLSQQGRQRLRHKTMGRFYRQCGDHTPYVLLHAIADNLGKGDLEKNRNDRMVSFFKTLLVTYLDTVSATAASPLINGNDLIRHLGLQPSPLLGQLLRDMEELRMAGKLESREQAFAWVTGYLKKCKKKRPNPLEAEKDA